MNHSADMALITRARGNDRAAVAAVLETLRQAATKAVHRLGATQSLIDDIVQHVAERLWLGPPPKAPALESYNGQAPLLAWLKVITYRVGLDLQAQRERPCDDALLEHMLGPLQPLALPEQAAAAAHLRTALTHALRSLAPRDRALLRAHFIDGARLGDLAQRFDVTRGTMARWVACARAAVVAQTQAALREALGVDATLPSLLATAASQLECSLSALE